MVQASDKDTLSAETGATGWCRGSRHPRVLQIPQRSPFGDCAYEKDLAAAVIIHDALGVPARTCD